jgi:hypothetical protein
MKSYPLVPKALARLIVFVTPAKAGVHNTLKKGYVHQDEAAHAKKPQSTVLGIPQGCRDVETVHDRVLARRPAGEKSLPLNGSEKSGFRLSQG